MTYYSTSMTSGVRNMWIFGKRKRQASDDARDRQIQAIHEETLKKIEHANKSTKRLNKQLEQSTTYLIFLATGGGRRGKR